MDNLPLLASKKLIYYSFGKKDNALFLQLANLVQTRQHLDFGITKGLKTLLSK